MSASDPTSLSPLRQGFTWWSFAPKQADPDSLLQAAARIGYAAVELIDEALWPAVARHGLALGAAAGHASIGDGLNRPENSARIEAELLASLRKAEQWKIPVLICFSGNRNEGQDSEAALDACAATLARVAPRAADAGVTLAVELLNSRFDHPGYQADRTEWGVELCRRVASPAVRLLYDIYHMQIMEGDVIRTIREHHAWFAHYHTAGVPGRGQPDATQELNYPAIYRAITATGYRGLVSHEFYPPGDPVAALEAAFRDGAAG
jgi:hydroxypyruvate isomerase